jgi:peptidoglycan/xylan/chitin deacetylase (PgdA/CDA1 family)
MFFKSLFNKLYKKARGFCINVLFKIFNVIPKKVKTTKGLRILVYHGVCKKDPHRFNSRFISATQFEEHLLLLKKYFHLISYDDLKANRLSNEKLNVLLTFDDGLKNNFTLALPLLNKHQVPALFFVTGLTNTDFPFAFNDLVDIIPYFIKEPVEIHGRVFSRIKKGEHWRLIDSEGKSIQTYYHDSSYNKRKEVLDELLLKVPLSQLKDTSEYFELTTNEEWIEVNKSTLHTIASHGYYHTNLTSIAKEELQYEISASLHYMQSLTKTQVRAIAFPYGHFNTEVIACCIKNGCVDLFGTETIEENTNSAYSLHQRFTVNPYISAVNQMYHIAKNNYE